MNFTEILKQYKKIAIIGTSKNAGKTVTLNELINIADNNSIRLGITSIGRDGERKDIVTDTEKPPIYVKKGTFLATAEGCLVKSTASFEIIDVTNLHTAMGRIVVCEIMDEGYVEIAGPDSSTEIKKVSDFMLELGADTVLIDGALNRKTQASPAVADAAILATGAVVSRSMDMVIERTKHTVKMLTLPQVEKDILALCEEAATSSQVAFIDKDKNIINTSYKTVLGIADDIICQVKEDYEFIVIPGTLMGSFLRGMQQLVRYKKIKIVVKDGTKIFVEPMDYKIFERNGGEIYVMEPINLMAVTVNPYSPDGYFFEPELFLKAMKDELYPIDVYDCMQGGF
ncbi:hypothetical protein Q428_00445 [Fervidicella metallireducens AeB]|uniref:Uncharacterized protein n=1 Tax=Fervidicella metallireducens AeB TaxID=1403537 RepID=A0A017RYP1_9CLOT|nr:hypothetical protein [Fervidicella metallireducens]EYE89797.1 hypothetical protein Q428_00445 [Fervidicella metallireducens AeB]